MSVAFTEQSGPLSWQFGALAKHVTAFRELHELTLRFLGWRFSSATPRMASLQLPATRFVPQRFIGRGSRDVITSYALPLSKGTEK